MTSGEILCVRSELWRMAKIKDSTKSNFRIQISLNLNDKVFEEPVSDKNYLNQKPKFCKIFKIFQKAPEFWLTLVSKQENKNQA